MLEPKFAETLVILNCCTLRGCYCFVFKTFVCVIKWIGTTAVFGVVYKLGLVEMVRRKKVAKITVSSESRNFTYESPQFF